MGLLRQAALVMAATALFAAGLRAAELQQRTAKAFDAYVAAAEARPEAPFLWIDSLAPPDRLHQIDALRRGELVIERMRAREHGGEPDVPGGLVHHWIGTVFVPHATLDRVLGVLQDYDRHASIYAPAVARSKLLARDGDEFRFALRFVMTKVITVVVDGEHEARFASPGPGRARSWIRSTRLSEVANAGTAKERHEPVGGGGGYLWRLNTYWRFDQRDGGVYVECESISLTRGIPLGLGWIVGPFITSLPRESLEFTLQTTRRTVMAEAGDAE